MSFLRLGGIQVDSCEACAGTWFDDGELEALPAELSEQELAKEAVRALDGLRGLKSAVLPMVRYVPCPVCGAEMNRRNYQRVSGIILNRCPGHGTWLDFTNGKALLQLLADGRLGEVKQRADGAAAEDRRRESAELDRARRDLDARRLDAAMEYQGLYPGPYYRPRGILWWLLDFFS